MDNAPELVVSEWLNTDSAPTLASLRGKVILIEAFQMLCPGCVSHALPQAKKVFETFSRDDVAVLGLHTVFEHHSAQGTADALGAFLHEYRIPFPVGIDQPSEAGPLPTTMTTYQMQGTPTQLLIDRNGRLRAQRFGAVEDLRLGMEIGALLAEPAPVIEPAPSTQSPDPEEPNCDKSGCHVP